MWNMRRLCFCLQQRQPDLNGKSYHGIADEMPIYNEDLSILQSRQNTPGRIPYCHEALLSYKEALRPENYYHCDTVACIDGSQRTQKYQNHHLDRRVIPINYHRITQKWRLWRGAGNG